MQSFLKPVLIQFDATTKSEVIRRDADPFVRAMGSWMNGAPCEFYVNCLLTDLALGQIDSIYERCVPMIEADLTFDVIVVNVFLQRVELLVDRDHRHRLTLDLPAEVAKKLNVQMLRASWDDISEDWHLYHLKNYCETGMGSHFRRGTIPCVTCPVCESSLSGEWTDGPYGYRARYWFDCYGSGNLRKFPNRGCRKRYFTYSEMRKMLDGVSRLDFDTSTSW